MTTREQLLTLLEENPGTYFSGEEIARRLGVSRAAVWKAMKVLRQEGLPIDAVTNRGYRLAPASDILSPQALSGYLPFPADRLTVLNQVSSTNSWIRERAEEGAPEGTTVVANCQSAGRGRYGRSFYSPGDTGIYLSILLRPDQYTLLQVPTLTAVAAVTLCQAIQEVCGVSPQIKWVNDIFLEGKKVCGILSQASIGMESGCMDYAVLGVGINLYPPREPFPPELASIAGWILNTPSPGCKNRLAGTFLSRFWQVYTHPQPEEILREYRSRSLILGKPITVSEGQHSYKAKALDIDRDFRLVVEPEDGEIRRLSYGEVHISL